MGAMKAIFLFAALLQAGSALSAQLPNAKTETLRIAGKCSLCKQAIETAASKKGEAMLAWDLDSHLAELTYDSATTNADEVLKRVAYAGYDNERYLAPAEAYAALDECCRYERVPQAIAAVASVEARRTGKAEAGHKGHVPSIDGALEAYFALKDALVEGKAEGIPSRATGLAKLLEALSAPEAKKTASAAREVAKGKTIEGQRAAFAKLSESFHALAKANPPAATVYYQHCPMYTHGKVKGANWLSAEKAIRNPYYGDRMLTCGSVVETLGGKSAPQHRDHE